MEVYELSLTAFKLTQVIYKIWLTANARDPLVSLWLCKPFEQCIYAKFKRQ